MKAFLQKLILYFLASVLTGIGCFGLTIFTDNKLNEGNLWLKWGGYLASLIFIISPAYNVWESIIEKVLDLNKKAIIPPQKPSSVGTPKQANNKVRFRDEFIAFGIILVLSILILSVAKDGSFFVSLGGLGVWSSVTYLLTRGLWCLYVNWKNRSGSRK